MIRHIVRSSFCNPFTKFNYRSLSFFKPLLQDGDAVRVSHQVGGKSPVSCYNEWDPLEEVIVGRPDLSCVPALTPEVKACISPESWDFFNKNARKQFPAKFVQKAKEETDELCNILRHEGVVVKRPDIVDWTREVKTPDFTNTGMYAAMPRDILMVIGDEILEAPMSWRSRFFEFRAYRTILKDYFKAGAKWTAAPKSQMSDELFDKDYPFEDEEKRMERAKEDRFILTEFEPCFDAADFTRCGRDIFAQISHVTNMFGIEWVARHLGPNFNVRILKFDETNPKHIDGTFCPIRPGLAIVNPERRCHQARWLEKKGWKLVDAVKPVFPQDHPLWLSSKWLNMNILMLDENRVVCSKTEEPIQKMFQGLGLTTIPVEMKFANSFGGSLHCWTCDVRRKGTLECYF